MDFYDLIKIRYSCRKFKDKPVEKERLEAVLEAGRLSPTGGNEQPQRILVIQGKEARSFMEECTMFSFGAPIILVCCYDREHTAASIITGKSTGSEDVSIVMTYMMLACYDQGLANTWVATFDEAKMRDFFKIPDTYEIIGLMPLGYAAVDAQPSNRHAQREPLSKTVAFDSF